jgi:hypothetical protein
VTGRRIAAVLFVVALGGARSPQIRLDDPVRTADISVMVSCADRPIRQPLWLVA